MLKNNQIIIKPLEKKHLGSLMNLRNDPEIRFYLTSILPINEHMQEEWFKTISLDDSKMYFAIENRKGEFLGLVRCDEWDKINRSIRIGVDIIPTQQRKGYSTAAYTLLFRYLFHDLGINRVWLLVTEYNKKALALYKKLHFVEEGKQRAAIFRKGKFHDYMMMSILKKEYDTSF